MAKNVLYCKYIGIVEIFGPKEFNLMLLDVFSSRKDRIHKLLVEKENLAYLHIYVFGWILNYVK